jgi:superfamily I DNA/RNA helicase
MQHDMGLAPGDIAVLTAQSPSKCGLGAEGEIGNLPVTFDASDSRRVLLATAQSFKGLERPAIILAGIDRAVENEQRQILYVAMSRARLFLAIVGSRGALVKLKGWIG